MRSEHRNKVIVILVALLALASIFNFYYNFEYPYTGMAELEISDGGHGGGGSSGICGNGIREEGEGCDSGNDLIFGTEDDDFGIFPTCESRFYDGGELVCEAGCSLNQDGCYDFDDGECEEGETCSQSPEDCSGTQADCSSGQLCQNVMGSGTCIAAAPSVCNDTTAMNTCSNITGAPWYCDSNADLVENCGECGCPSGQSCNETDNSTCIINSQASHGSIVGQAGIVSTIYTIDDAIVLSEASYDVDPIDSAGAGYQYSWNEISHGDVIEFEVGNVGFNENNNEVQLSSPVAQTHTIEVNRISRARKYVEVTIRSDPIDVILYEGEPQRVDVDKDGVEDVVVLATNIGLRDFNIDIQEIDKEKLQSENILKDVVTKIQERKVFFPGPLLSPVLEESPEANIYEFIVVNSLIVISMVFYFFKLTKAVKKK